MKRYSSCNRPNACCPEIAHDEKNDIYVILDNAAHWESGEIVFGQLIQIRDLINKIESERKDIKHLD